MNDFTKEELVKLKNGIEYLSDRTSLSNQYLKGNIDLAHKIQSLIDNYCDHEHTKSHTMNVRVCDKCQTIF